MRLRDDRGKEACGTRLRGTRARARGLREGLQIFRTPTSRCGPFRGRRPRPLGVGLHGTTATARRSKSTAATCSRSEHGRSPSRTRTSRTAPACRHAPARLGPAHPQQHREAHAIPHHLARAPHEAEASPARRRSERAEGRRRRPPRCARLAHHERRELHARAERLDHGRRHRRAGPRAARASASPPARPAARRACETRWTPRAPHS